MTDRNRCAALAREKSGPGGAAARLLGVQLRDLRPARIHFAEGTRRSKGLRDRS